MHLFRDPVLRVCAVLAGVLILVGIGLALVTPAAPAAAPAPGSIALADVGSPRDLAAAIGRSVTAERAEVLSVPADEGFWVATGGSGRAWVQLETAGESPFTVRAGQRVTFEGRVVAHGADFAQRPEFPAADAAELTAAGAHVEVAPDAMALQGS